MVARLMSFDANKDGKLTKEEVPERMQGIFERADANKDGRITAGELQEYLAEMVGRQAMGMSRRQQPQLFGDAERVLVGR